MSVQTCRVLKTKSTKELLKPIDIYIQIYLQCVHSLVQYPGSDFEKRKLILKFV